MHCRSLRERRLTTNGDLRVALNCIPATRPAPRPSDRFHQRASLPTVCGNEYACDLVRLKINSKYGQVKCCTAYLATDEFHRCPMAIQFHPEQGTIVICDFAGFIAPEMVKRRPAIIVSPRLRQRDRLCTVVPLSTTPPNAIAPYHFKLHVVPVLPKPYDAAFHWVKADMLYTVSFDRLSIPFDGKDASGKRKYDVRVIAKADLLKIQHCMLCALGLPPWFAPLDSFPLSP